MNKNATDFTPTCAGVEREGFWCIIIHSIHTYCIIALRFSLKNASRFAVRARYNYCQVKAYAKTARVRFVAYGKGIIDNLALPL
jgi:hypothetical protein